MNSGACGGQEDGAGYPGDGVADGWKPSSGVLQEQYILFTTEPSPRLQTGTPDLDNYYGFENSLSEWNEWMK